MLRIGDSPLSLPVTAVYSSYRNFILETIFFDLNFINCNSSLFELRSSAATLWSVRGIAVAVSSVYISAELTSEGTLYWTGSAKGTAVLPVLNVNASIDIEFDVMTSYDGIEHVRASMFHTFYCRNICY